MQHKAFPLGAFCCHCDTWASLRAAVRHISDRHPKCGHCQADAGLIEGLLLDRDFMLFEAQKKGVPVTMEYLFN